MLRAMKRNQAITIGEQGAIDRIRAREIDGADHDVRPMPLRAKCLVCGGATYRSPALPYALIHRETTR